MHRPIPYKRDRREYWPVIAAGLALAGIVSWLLFGTTGVFAWNDYNRALGARTAELAQLKADQARLRNHLRLLNPRHVDPDMMDEAVRQELNLLHPDEVVIPLK